MASGGSPTAMCNCRGQYDTCFADAVRGSGAGVVFRGGGGDVSVVSQGCPAASVAAVVQGCVMSGCTAAQCAPSESFMLGLKSCDEAGLAP